MYALPGDQVFWTSSWPLTSTLKMLGGTYITSPPPLQFAIMMWSLIVLKDSCTMNATVLGIPSTAANSACRFLVSQHQHSNLEETFVPILILLAALLP
jgi:hypothetical protein